VRILYVEDHARFRALVIRNFLAGHEVTAAETLARARELLAEGEFDAVLLDYDLPDGKGSELLDCLRARDPGGMLRVRVVAVSSRDDANEVLVRAGAIAAVNKLRMAELTEVLEAVLPGSEKAAGPGE
jgi:DNA-binding response OmpR family regulator